MKEHQFIEGGALNSFGESFGFDGKDFQSDMSYKLFGTTINYLLDNNVLEIPNFIKIDVDGIEHLILEGGSEVLKSVKSILFEVNDNFEEQSHTINKRLTESGFFLFKKCDMGDEFFFNQWWMKQGGNE